MRLDRTATGRPGAAMARSTPWEISYLLLAEIERAQPYLYSYRRPEDDFEMKRTIVERVNRRRSRMQRLPVVSSDPALALVSTRCRDRLMAKERPSKPSST